MSTQPEKEIADLRTILDITRHLGGALELDELLQLIINEATRIMAADRSSLFIYDKGANELWIKIAEGIQAKEIRLPVNEKSIVGTVALRKELMNIPDAYACELFNPDVDKRTGYKTRSILSCPLLNFKNEIVGVIQVLNKNDGQAFSKYDEELLSALSSSAALAIERTMLISEFLENEKLKQEMQIARTIQISLLPEEIPAHPAMEVAGYSEACDETGGDYYDVFELDDNQLGIVVGDISGHGVGAALLMATARAFLRALLRKEKDYAQLFKDLNDMLEQDMDDSRFMTMFLGVLDTDRRISYVSAGHEPPLILHAASGEFSDLDSTGIVLGMMDDMDYEMAGPVSFEPGDIFVLYTDGVFEAMNTEQEEFGQDRVKDLLREHMTSSPQKIIDTLTDAVTAFRGEAPQRDDITLVVGKVL